MYCSFLWEILKCMCRTRETLLIGFISEAYSEEIWFTRMPGYLSGWGFSFTIVIRAQFSPLKSSITTILKKSVKISNCSVINFSDQYWLLHLVFHIYIRQGFWEKFFNIGQVSCMVLGELTSTIIMLMIDIVSIFCQVVVSKVDDVILRYQYSYTFFGA